MERAGEIRDLEWQHPLLIQEAFIYHGKKEQKITYKADFFYYVKNDSYPTVEDVKGQDPVSGKHMTTKDFLIKWKLLKFRYPHYNFVIY